MGDGEGTGRKQLLPPQAAAVDEPRQGEGYRTAGQERGDTSVPLQLWPRHLTTSVKRE